MEGPWAGLTARGEDQGQRAAGHLCSGVGRGPLPRKLGLRLSVKCPLIFWLIFQTSLCRDLQERRSKNVHWGHHIDACFPL